MYKIGIDVGGMSIKAGVVVNGEITARAVKETNQSGGLENMIKDIIDLVENLLVESKLVIKDIDSIGIGFPGIVTKEGRVTCVNLGLENSLIVPKLEEYFNGTHVGVGNDANVAALAEYVYGSMKGYNSGVMITLGTGVGGGIVIDGNGTHVGVGNDANVAALAEYVYGSMKGYNSGVMITLGTGVGGGIVIDGNLIIGANGIGAEIGHTILDTNYYNCNCGNNGCFETFCSATAIIKYAQKLLNENRETIIRDMCENNTENITAKMVFDAYKENDEVAIEIVDRFKKYLAMGIGNIVNFIDPAVISIGGGVSNASEILLDGLSDSVKQYLPFKKAKIGDIVIAKFKNDAGIIGASAL